MIRIGLILLFGIMESVSAFATDRYFSDITEYSPSTRYRVEALSLDNLPDSDRGIRAFQANFVYTCTDTETGRELWNREQEMGEPIAIGDRLLSFPVEPSPVTMIVTDDAWTAIRTSGDAVLFVTPSGAEHGPVEILDEGISKEDREKYVQWTTAGEKWSGMSLWYFLRVGEKRLFVVRTWWGRHIVADAQLGRILPSTPRDIAEAIQKHEIDFVIRELKDRSQWFNVNDLEARTLTAAWLAGRLGVKEVIPELRELEKSFYCGSSTLGGLEFGHVYDKEVNPHRYRTLDMRQIAKLSLRRLGETPAQYPCYQFTWVENGTNTDYSPSGNSPRHESAPAIQVGMKAQEVLDRIGAPEEVSYDTWSYDMDAIEPYTLILTLDSHRITKIRRVSPAVWKTGMERDKALAQ